MKNQELQEAAEKARREINEQLEAFIVKMEKLRDDGVDHTTLAEIEQDWHRLKQKTSSIYADLAANTRKTLEKAGKLKDE